MQIHLNNNVFIYGPGSVRKTLDVKMKIYFRPNYGPLVNGAWHFSVLKNKNTLMRTNTKECWSWVNFIWTGEDVKLPNTCMYNAALNAVALCTSQRNAKANKSARNVLALISSKNVNGKRINVWIVLNLWKNTELTLMHSTMLTAKNAKCINDKLRSSIRKLNTVRTNSNQKTTF